MSTSNDDAFKLSHLQEFENVAKKPRLGYHDLKKIIRAKHNCTDMFFVEDKKHMASVEGHESTCHAQCAETMLRKNNGSILENQCHQGRSISIPCT
jgi:hypothetical protein